MKNEKETMSSLRSEGANFFAGTEAYQELFTDVNRALNEILSGAPEIVFDPVVDSAGSVVPASVAPIVF